MMDSIPLRIVEYTALLGDSAKPTSSVGKMDQIHDARRVWKGLHTASGNPFTESVVPCTRDDRDDGSETAIQIRELAKNLANNPLDIQRLFTRQGLLIESTVGENDGDTYTLNSWRRSVLLTEVAITSLRIEDSLDPSLADELLIQAQWTLFILLSAPLRSVAPIWNGRRAYKDIVEIYSSDHLAGDRYLSRLRRVRRWLLTAIEHFEDHSILRRTPALNLEKAVSLLVFVDEKGKELLPLPENLRLWMTKRTQSNDPRNNSVVEPKPLVGNLTDLDDLEELVEHFFLPRFDIKAARKAARAASSDSHRYAQISVCIGIFASCGALAVFLLWPSYTLLWPILAVLGCALIFGPALLVPRLAQQAWLLRIPASASMGVLVVLALSAQWWKESRIWPGQSGQIGATLLLLSLALCYICFEVSGHRVGENTEKRKRTIFGRAIVIFGLLLATSILITLISFGFLFPVFAENTDILTNYSDYFVVLPEDQIHNTFFQQLASVNTAERFWMLLLPSSLVTVIGLFTQVLWDDKAITAPLAHTSWRK